MPPWTQIELLTELEPVVGRELDRHLRAAREWFPHEYVPWSDGRNFDGVLDGDAWDPSQSRVSEVARTALVVNLLTEDNLPSYHRDIYESFGTDGAWGTWIGRWTAEEGRHGIAIRDYLLTTRAVDPVTLERERMVHMTQGFASSYDLDMLHTVAYVSFQDENLHMVFYRNLLQAALELAPNETMRAICDVVSTFQMPGNTIEGFTRRSVQIAMAGIYDLRIHRDEVLAPILRSWDVWDRVGLSGEGEQAREQLGTYFEELDRQANRFEERRAARQARAEATPVKPR